MIIITYSETNAETIEQRLGKAEYSYYFIYKKYLPILQKLGKLVAVNDPVEEVDRIFFENPAEECLFLSFSPPHRTVLNLSCPTVCVFAWEFSTIPEESWHNHPEYNWARTLEKIGNAVTISEYAAKVVNEAIPTGLNLAVIPAAVETVDASQLTGKPQNGVIQVLATLYDSRSYNLTRDMVNDTVNGSRDPLQMQPWNDETLNLSFTEDSPEATELLIGFYSAEEWGTWSRTKMPWIMLPHHIKGPVIIQLEMVAYGTNIGREIEFSLGDEKVHITPDDQPQTYTMTFEPENDVDILKITNLDLAHAPGARDHRSLGIGVKSMTIMRPEGYEKVKQNSFVNSVRRLFARTMQALKLSSRLNGNALELNGIVYTCVMNPQDGRKNWEDMVTAFCWAFRDEENATLVLKMTHHNLATFLGKLLLLYSQMSPFKCRVVAVHGFLTDDQYQSLMDRTHFVVNSSHCEGSVCR
ncbi:MAG: hypothetical protein R3E54_14345 [Halioglobus sp.]